MVSHLNADTCLADSNLDWWVSRWEGCDATDVPIMLFSKEFRGRTDNWIFVHDIYNK